MPEGLWVQTEKRWRAEGMTDADVGLIDFDGLARVSVKDMTPPFETEVLQREGDKVVMRAATGEIVRTWEHGEDHSPGYQVLESPVRDWATWESIKPRLDPDHPDHTGEGWAEMIEEVKNSGQPVTLDAGHSFSIFGYTRDLMGDGVYTTFYDDPSLMHEIMDFLGERIIRLMERASEHVRIDMLRLWEDMAYKGAPLISPKLFKEFMLEPTRRVCDAARRLGIPCIRLDSDGDVTQLIPLWLEAGVNAIEPFEVAAGMDVNKVRAEFGDDLFMMGGFDKRVLAQSQTEIDAEFTRLRPAIEEGRYFLSVDHSIPPDGSWDNYRYYAQRKMELAGEGVGFPSNMEKLPLLCCFQSFLKLLVLRWVQWRVHRPAPG